MATLPQSLAEWRDREGVGLEQLARSLRVEASTLERIEAGEVAPGNELRERIGKTMERGFNHDQYNYKHYGLSSSDEFPLAAPLIPGPALEGEGAATDDGPAAAPGRGEVSLVERVASPVSFPAWGAWLAKRDGDEWEIELLSPSGHVESFSIAAAFALAVKLNQLVAAHDAGPDGFGAVFG